MRKYLYLVILTILGSLKAKAEPRYFIVYETSSNQKYLIKSDDVNFSVQQSIELNSKGLVTREVASSVLPPLEKIKSRNSASETAIRIQRILGDSSKLKIVPIQHSVTGQQGFG